MPRALRVAAALPEVDAALDGELIDRAQLVVTELQVVQGRDVFLELSHAARSDEYRRDAGIAQTPRQRAVQVISWG